MPTIYTLPSCSTCQRILKELKEVDGWLEIDIKGEPISEKELDGLAKKVGGYEALFSRRARLYRERNLKEQVLSEDDYKRLILEHYTFIKRPLMLVGNQLFVGNAKKTIEQVKEACQKNKG